MSQKKAEAEPVKKQDSLPVKSFQVGLPSDLSGSKTTFAASRHTTMVLTALGVEMRNHATKRRLLAPIGNIKMIELPWDL